MRHYEWLFVTTSENSSSLFEYFYSEAQLLPLMFVGTFSLKVDSHMLLIKVGNTCSEIYLLDKVSEPSIITNDVHLSPEQQAFVVMRISHMCMRLHRAHCAFEKV